MTINFDELKDKAINMAQYTAQKTKDLACIAKAKLSIVAEEEKIRKAQLELGKLYYRDYAVGEEMDSAEYLPWCDKITESRAVIEDLKDLIADLKEKDGVTDEEIDAVKPEDLEPKTPAAPEA